MDHQQVNSSDSIERYVFGRLTPQEMEQLEVHLFECSECVAELRETAMFLSNARVVLRERLPEAIGLAMQPFGPERLGGFLQRFHPSL